MAAANLTPSLTCEVCTATVTLYSKFCATCGAELDEETLALKYYFNEGYEYEVILCFLLEYHGIEMSMRTLKDRFKSRKLLDSNDQDVRARIKEELDGPGCLSGYRSLWHTLRREGYQVSRQAVATCLQEMDAEGCERRRRRKLKRRVYTNPGPNYCWHIDDDTLYMNSVKTKTKNVLLAVYTALYSLHSELYRLQNICTVLRKNLSAK